MQNCKLTSCGYFIKIYKYTKQSMYTYAQKNRTGHAQIRKVTN